MKPFFSCVVPVKGVRPYLDEALASLHNQGLGDELEIIIQDGDAEPDDGQSDAFNKGFAKARGEWLFWLNADDILLPGALEKVRRLAQTRRSLSWIAGNMVTIDAEERVLACLRDRGMRAAYEGHPIRVFGPSSFFRRELLSRVGGFDTSLRYSMDTDLWMKFREAGHWFEKIPDYLFAFRIHAGSRTANPAMTAVEHARQDAEVLPMEARHGVTMTTADRRKLRLRRLLDGSLLRGWVDGWRFRGRHWREVAW